MPVEAHAAEPMIIPDNKFVPPLTFKVPLEPAFCATRTVLACHVPLDTVIRPMPLSPTNVPLGFTNSPPVNHTVPLLRLELDPKNIAANSVVPPANVTVPE